MRAPNLSAMALTMRCPRPVEPIGAEFGETHAVIFDADHGVAACAPRPQADANGAFARRIGVLESVDHQLVDDDADRDGAVRIGLDRVGRERELRERVALGGVSQVLDQRIEILIDCHRLDVLGGVEAPMHLGDRHHAGGGIEQRGLHFLARIGLALHLQHCRDQLQRVADAVVDLLQQDRALLGQRLEAVARQTHFGFRGLLCPAHPHRLDRALERRLQQRNELALRILDHVVERTRLEGGHDQFAVLGAGDEDDRWVVRNRMNARKRAEPVETRHVLVERDDVEFLCGERLQTALAIGRADDANSFALQPA